jgi:hypothetical protein
MEILSEETHSRGAFSCLSPWGRVLEKLMVA